MNQRPPVPQVEAPPRERSKSVSEQVAAQTSRKRQVGIVIACAVLALLCIGAVAWFAARRGSGDVPRLNSDTVTLVKFINSDQYAKLPFDRQALFMKVIEDRADNDELDKAFLSQKISEAEFRGALQEAWLGEQLKRSEKYANLPVGAPRANFIAEIIERKEQKRVQALKSPTRVKPPTEADEIKRDQTLEEIRIKQWPEMVRAQWQNFRKAYEEQRDAREQMAKAAAAAAAAATTQPVSESR